MLIIHSKSLRLSDAGWTLPRSSNQLYGFYPKDCVRHQEENQRETTCLQERHRAPVTQNLEQWIQWNGALCIQPVL